MCERKKGGLWYLHMCVREKDSFLGCEGVSEREHEGIFGPYLKYFIHRNVSSMQSFRNIGIHYVDLNA